MTVTPKKLAANRANSLKSTGPRTAEGKRRTSMNGVTHGMFCREIVLPDEDAREFEQFRSAVLRKLSPQDVVELMICDRIVTAHWKLRRLNAREANARRVRSADPVARARRYVQRDRDEREYDALTYGKKFKPTARDRADDRLFAEYEREQSSETANKLMRLAPAELPCDEADNDNYADEQIDRWSRIEQRLELSIHRNLRALERMRKQSQSEQETEPAQCPFLPEVAVEESNAEDDQIEQSEAKESDQAEPTTNDQEPITNNEQEDDEESSRMAIRGLGQQLQQTDDRACMDAEMRLTRVNHHATAREI